MTEAAHELTITEETPPPRASFLVVITTPEGVRSEHLVHLDADFLAACKGGSPVELVRQSMTWLLTREAPDAIMPAFDLRDITRFFPEYPGVLTRDG